MSHRLYRRRKVEVKFPELAKRVRPKDHIAEHWQCCQQAALRCGQPANSIGGESIVPLADSDRPLLLVRPSTRQAMPRTVTKGLYQECDELRLSVPGLCLGGHGERAGKRWK